MHALHFCFVLLFQLSQFHRSSSIPMKDKMSNTALVFCPSINQEILESYIALKKQMNQEHCRRCEKNMIFWLWNINVYRSDISAFCFVNQLTLSDFNGTVSFSMKVGQFLQLQVSIKRRAIVIFYFVLFCMSQIRKKISLLRLLLCLKEEKARSGIWNTGIYLLIFFYEVFLKIAVDCGTTLPYLCSQIWNEVQFVHTAEKTERRELTSLYSFCWFDHTDSLFQLFCIGFSRRMKIFLPI